MEIIKRIKKWQKDRLLDKMPFNWSNEATNIVEELIEILGYKVPKEKREDLRQEFGKFVADFVNKHNLEELQEDEGDRIVDGLSDIVIFAVGGMMKAGYEPTCVLNETLKHIESRTGKIINGKFVKDENVKTYTPQYDKCIKDEK